MEELVQLEIEPAKDSNSQRTTSPVDIAIDGALEGVLNKQDADGFWLYELESDIAIACDYVMMMHYLGDIDIPLQNKIANYIRRRQQENGGWPMYPGGKTNISNTVKAYYALKLIGDTPEQAHMLLARRAILEKGGAAKSDAFTRIMLAKFGQVPWRAVPFIPVEIMLLPKWFPLHISKISYWARTTMVPLLILYNFRATAKNPTGIGVRELFETLPEKEKHYFPTKTRLSKLILILEKTAYKMRWLIPGFVNKMAIKKAENWFIERLNGESGIGAIFPAMRNAYEALLLLGYSEDDEMVKTARKAIDLLLVVKEDEAYCQACISPVWDTLLASQAIFETNDERAIKQAHDGMKWLQTKQIVDGNADWREDRPDLRPGGWAFQMANDFYPDLDDTSFAGLAMVKIGFEKYKKNIKLAADWIAGMQSKNGGFASYEIDNTQYYLNEIPFADHGAILDPPTADVTGRCVMFLASVVDRYPEYQNTIKKGLDYLTREQEEDGSWWGRWGTNYVYGTWTVLMAFEEMKIGGDDERVKKAVTWLKSVQREDGGWGEDNDSYESFGKPGLGYRSTAFQTAWAMMGLMAAGEASSESVLKGVNYLLSKQEANGLWYDPEFMAPGFPKVLYLKYHGYDKYFPLWALARYRNEMNKIAAS